MDGIVSQIDGWKTFLLFYSQWYKIPMHLISILNERKIRSSIKEWHLKLCLTVYIGMCVTQSMKKPRLFWVSAGAPLVSVILSTILVFAFKAQRQGISVVSFRVPFCCLSPLHEIMLLIARPSRCLSDWKVTRRAKPSLMEHVAFSWKLPWTGCKNWPCYWHHFPHCEVLFYLQLFSYHL